MPALCYAGATDLPGAPLPQSSGAFFVAGQASARLSVFQAVPVDGNRNHQGDNLPLFVGRGMATRSRKDKKALLLAVDRQGNAGEGGCWRGGMRERAHRVTPDSCYAVCVNLSHPAPLPKGAGLLSRAQSRKRKQVRPAWTSPGRAVRCVAWVGGAADAHSFVDVRRCASEAPPLPMLDITSGGRLTVSWMA
jgi:hypothetical protein